MKILIDASITSVGGGVQVALSIINNIVDDPEFEVICVTNPEIDKQLLEETKLKFSHYYVENIVPIYLKYSQGKRISLIEKKHNPDIVFVIFGPSYWKPKAISLQGFALGKMLYQKELNMGLIEKCLNFIKAQFFKWSKSYLLVETQLVKLKLGNYLNYPKDKIFIIGNSYSPDFNKYIIENNSIIKPPIDKFLFLVPGSYYPHKNLEKLIESISLIRKECEKKSKQIKFLFTIPPESESWIKLYKLAQYYKVENFIETVGFVQNVQFAELYLKSNAVICASLVESSTAVFPEAFLAERPLLVSDRPFAKDLCENAALYFDPLDSHSIANAILEISENIELQRTLIHNANIVLKKNYPSAEEKWIQQRDLILKLVK